MEAELDIQPENEGRRCINRRKISLSKLCRLRALLSGPFSWCRIQEYSFSPCAIFKSFISHRSLDESKSNLALPNVSQLQLVCQTNWAQKQLFVFTIFLWKRKKLICVCVLYLLHVAIAEKVICRCNVNLPRDLWNVFQDRFTFMVRWTHTDLFLVLSPCLRFLAIWKIAVYGKNGNSAWQHL